MDNTQIEDDANDMTCWEESSRISCAAMTEMAKAEAVRNNKAIVDRWSDPACERFREVRDLSREMHMWKGIGLSKEHCFIQDHPGTGCQVAMCQGNVWKKDPWNVPLPGTSVTRPNAEVVYLQNTRRK